MKFVQRSLAYACIVSTSKHFEKFSTLIQRRLSNINWEVGRQGS